MRKLLIAALSAALLVFSAGTGFAADAARVEKIGVVDLQALVATSKAGKSLQEQINKQRESFKTEFTKLEKDLGETQKKLEADKANQNTPEFATKRKDFETKMASAQKLVQEKRQSLEKGAAEGVFELRKAVAKVVAEIAEKEKYTLVVTRDNVVLAEENMDITAKVMTQLDKTLPDVKLKLEAVK